MTRLKDGPGEENNPIVRYQEWAEHRYDPGHWLGANTPPSRRNVWSSFSPRALGAAYVATCIVGIGLAFRYARSRDDFFVVGLGLLVYSVPGVIVLFARRKRPRQKTHHQK